MKMVWHYKNEALYADELQFFENLKSRAVKYSDLDRKDLKGIGFFKEDKAQDSRCMTSERFEYLILPVKIGSEGRIICNLTEDPEPLDIVWSLREVGLTRCYYEKKEAIRKGGFLGLKKVGEQNVTTEQYVTFYDYRPSRARIEQLVKDQIVYPLYAPDLEKILQYIEMDEGY